MCLLSLRLVAGQGSLGPVQARSARDIAHNQRDISEAERVDTRSSLPKPEPRHPACFGSSTSRSPTALGPPTKQIARPALLLGLVPYGHDALRLHELASDYRIEQCTPRQLAAGRVCQRPRIRTQASRQGWHRIWLFRRVSPAPSDFDGAQKRAGYTPKSAPLAVPMRGSQEPQLPSAGE